MILHFDYPFRNIRMQNLEDSKAQVKECLFFLKLLLKQNILNFVFLANIHFYNLRKQYNQY